MPAYVTRCLAAPLDQHIENLWYFEDEPSAGARHTIMASGRTLLSINLSGERTGWYGGEKFAECRCTAGAVLAGPSSHALAVDGFHGSSIGVQFRAGGALAFFGPVVHELRDTQVPLSAVWGADAERLHQRLVDEPDLRRQFAILLGALKSKISRPLERNRAVMLALDHIARRPQHTRIATLARQLEFEPKRLIAHFHTEVGLTPKLYLRIARFQHLLTHAAASPRIDWADLAAQFGYYDQPHLIRDFQAFSGLTPSAWLKSRGPLTQHVPLPG